MYHCNENHSKWNFKIISISEILIPMYDSGSTFMNCNTF